MLETFKQLICDNKEWKLKVCNCQIIGWILLIFTHRESTIKLANLLSTVKSHVRTHLLMLIAYYLVIQCHQNKFFPVFFFFLLNIPQKIKSRGREAMPVYISSHLYIAMWMCMCVCVLRKSNLQKLFFKFAISAN